MLQESKPNHNGEGMGYVNFKEGGWVKRCGDSLQVVFSLMFLCLIFFK